MSVPLQQRLEDVRQRIQRACERAGRSATSVTLVAITKMVPVAMMREAIGLGVTEIGENRVQEALAKQAELSANQTPLHWHLVGHLQRNKAKHAIEGFDVIHSVDSLPLIETLEVQAQTYGRSRPLDVFVQVNVSGETAKRGCPPEDLDPMALKVQQARHLNLVGLMTMTPLALEAEASRPHYRRLRELRDRLGGQLKLSMGMSGDFEVAIEEGADVVRIGTAIFGVRDTGHGAGQG